MSDFHAVATAYIDGLKTSIDRLGLDAQDDRAKGYRMALDDIGGYLEFIKSGEIEKEALEEAIYQLQDKLSHKEPGDA